MSSVQKATAANCGVNVNLKEAANASVHLWGWMCCVLWVGTTSWSTGTCSIKPERGIRGSGACPSSPLTRVQCSAVQCSERGGHLRLPMPMTSQGAEGLLWARGEWQEARLLGVPDRDSGRHCAAGEETRWRSWWWLERSGLWSAAGSSDSPQGSPLVLA